MKTNGALKKSIRKTLNDYAAKLLLAFSSLVFILIFLEIIFQLLNIKYQNENIVYENLFESLDMAKHPFYPGVLNQNSTYSLYKYKAGSTWYNIYSSNERGYFDKDNKIAYHMNSDGYRDDEFEKKSSSIFRIACIGDSFTMGEGVRFKDVFPTRLEEDLKSKNKNFDVLNLGINGYGIRDEIAFLEHHISTYKPDMIIWGYVLNDISRAAFNEWTNYMSVQKKKLYMDTPSYLLDFIQNKVWSVFLSHAYQNFVQDIYKDKRMWDTLDNLFKTSMGFIQSKNIEILVLIFPHLDAFQKGGYIFTPIHKKLHALFEETNIDYLDLTETFMNNDPKALKVHRVDAHPNEIAHRLTAEAILTRLSQNKKTVYNKKQGDEITFDEGDCFIWPLLNKERLQAQKACDEPGAKH